MRPGRARFIWVIGFLLLTLAVVYAAFIYLYVAYRNQLEEELGLRLIAVASSSAAAVNGPVWERMAAGDTAAMGTARRELDGIRRMNGVSDIFLFDTGEITVLDLADRYPVGELNLALVSDVGAATSALAGLPAATELYSSQGGYLKSAYAPVTGPAGEIVGGVGAEGSATFFEVLERVKRMLLAAAALVLAGMAILGAGFVRLLAAQGNLETRLRRTETLATMGQMAAMLAHEVRNPLGIIRGAAERLGARHGLEEDEFFRFIPEEVDRLERTLGTYLDFARPPGAGGGKAEDVRLSLTRTLDLVGPDLERKGIGVATQLEDGVFPVDGDAQLLQQAFLNLVLNARDAMADEGGTLTVALRRRGKTAEVTIADTGPGMPEEIRSRATEPFFTRKEKGSGLGLAVVKRVVEELGGGLSLQSPPAGGTAVVLTLPLTS